jgi:MFS family permease
LRLLGRDVYYGWVQVAVLGLTETVSWGIVYYAYAVLLAPMQREMGWSTAAATGAFSLALAVSGLAAFPVGRWLDRHGARAAMTAGSVLSVALLLAWSRVRGLADLYLVFAGLGVAMALVLYEPSFAVVATWFDRRRGQALTLLTTMAGFASTIFFPVTAWLVASRGWRDALVTLAVVLAAVTIPLHALVLRRRPEDLGLAPDGGTAASTAAGSDRPAVGTGDAVRGATFWWLALAFGSGTLVLVGVNVHLMPYLLGRGHDAAFAATVGGVIGFTKFPSRLLFGPLGDRLSLRALTAVLFALQVVALGVLLLAPSAVGALAFAVVFGTAVGAVTTARPALLAHLYGRGSYASISGALTASGVAARALAPVGIGLLYDGLGTYTPVLWGLAALSAISAAAVLASAPRTRPRLAPAASGRSA